ncbi:hypothetical protein PHJA_002620400 [Phtheirospermum japonicum]|uniref:Uncharacterized protein n=1 Tax=Phtheirospermum japonicum TaxID=374723 RepID=A0A830D954_9LAMI|nr:hypothetical protein PHJA_002620400 [Phtheirospermum japonicum]
MSHELPLLLNLLPAETTFDQSFSFLFLQAKVKIWVNGDEKKSIGALTADFGSILPAHAVRTIVTASFWPDITGSKDNDERYNELSTKVIVLLKHW